jgi:hypothetical protein
MVSRGGDGRRPCACRNGRFACVMGFDCFRPDAAGEWRRRFFARIDKIDAMARGSSKCSHYAQAVPTWVCPTDG